MNDEGFFHSRVGADNSAGPLRTTINIVDAPPMGTAASYEVFVPKATETFAYDADGNMITDGIWNYTWDGENRLVRMEMNAAIISTLIGQNGSALALTFAYDGMGRRILKQLDNATPYVISTKKGDETVVEFAPAYIKKYVYDIGSWNLSTALRCNPSSGAIIGPDQTFAWGPDLSGSEQGAGGIGGLAIYVDDYNDGGVGTTIGPMFPVYDGNGNILRLYDGQADANNLPLPSSKKAEYKYGPFGEQRGQTGSQATRFPFRWSTKFTDNETGLVYYGYRYYSPGIGRWLSRDRLTESVSRNLTAFLGNQSPSLVDPFGLSSFQQRLDPLPRVVREDRTGMDTTSEMESAIRHVLLTPDYVRELTSFMTIAGVYHFWEPTKRFRGGLAHFLDKSGTAMRFSFADMLRETTEGKRLARTEVPQAVELAQTLMRQNNTQTAKVSNTNWNTGVFAREVDLDWYGFFRGYTHFAYAEVSTSKVNPCKTSVSFDMYIYKDYNFDPPGESFSIGPWTFNARTINYLSLLRMAKNYDVFVSGKLRIEMDSSATPETWSQAAEDATKWSDPGFDPNLEPLGVRSLPPLSLPPLP